MTKVKFLVFVRKLGLKLILTLILYVFSLGSFVKMLCVCFFFVSIFAHKKRKYAVYVHKVWYPVSWELGQAGRGDQRAFETFYKTLRC